MAHRCYLTYLECSATGERHEAGRAHTLSRAGKPLLARYDLEALGRDVDPDALRRQPDGGLLLHWTSVPSASPYAPVYQADIAQYYRWVDAELLARFPNVFAVNLADEPIGSDFSPWAQAVFRERYGEELQTADPVLLGAFLAEFVADYAAISASLWAAVTDVQYAWTPSRPRLGSEKISER